MVSNTPNIDQTQDWLQWATQLARVAGTRCPAEIRSETISGSARSLPSTVRLLAPTEVDA
jgi:hypothetical protein